MSELPAIHASFGSGSKRSSLLYDPNPDARKFTFGTAKQFEWSDANQIHWHAELILPVGFEDGRRYPLIVQTHGFHPTEFLLDGPDGITTAFAAQAFANVGFVVLQMEDHPEVLTGDTSEGPRFAEGVSAAVEVLAASGLIDPSSVGLIGFSRTGYDALHVLARYPRLLSAVDISDSVQYGYLEAILAANDVGYAELARKINGVELMPQNVSEWFKHNPLYHLGDCVAAVRLEENGSTVPAALWETYALLRKSHRRVEFQIYPEGSHILEKPQERLASQGGNVDWFRFWLQGFEDPDPAKYAQYTRWRKLRSGN
jgi:hypothetical protein